MASDLDGGQEVCHWVEAPVAFREVNLPGLASEINVWPLGKYTGWQLDQAVALLV